MQPTALLINIFLTGIVVPVLFYHLLVLVRTGEKKHYYIGIIAAAGALYPLFFSEARDTLFDGTRLPYYLPVFEFAVAALLMYGIYGIASSYQQLSRPLFTGYLAITGALALFFMLFIITRDDTYFTHTQKLSADLPVQLLMATYLFFAASRPLPLFVRIPIALLALCSLLAATGTLIPFLAGWTTATVQFPIAIYLLSFFEISRHIQPVAVPDTKTELSEKPADKILVEKTGGTEEKAPAAIQQPEKTEPPIPEEATDIDLSTLLKKKITIYNELPDTFNKIQKAIRDNITLHAKQSDIERCIHALLLFIKNSKNEELGSYVTLTSDGKASYITAGEFVMDPEDRSLTMNKVRLTEIKKAAEELGGKLTLGKAPEHNGVLLRIKFEPAAYVSREENATIEERSDTPEIYIVTDDDALYPVLSEYLGERFTLIRADTPEELVDLIINRGHPVLVLAAMSNDADNEEAYYRIERLKELSGLPVLIIAHDKKPHYLELKSYRLIPADYLLHPVDRKLLMDKIDAISRKAREHRERNIHQIGTKIEKSGNAENGGQSEFMRAFEDKAALYLLAERERMIILYLLKGLEYREVAAKTGVSNEDLLKAVDVIYGKTGVSSRVELIDLFVR